MDGNLLQRDGATPAPAAILQRESCRDENSLVADAQFVDPAKGDYRVKEGSPALALGFVNFPMDQFGVQKPDLKVLARVPALPHFQDEVASIARSSSSRVWLGATVRNIADQGEMSAFGLPGVTGVLVLEVPAASVLAKSGLQKNDVILSVNRAHIADVAALPAITTGQVLLIGISRHQQEISLSIRP